MTSIPKSSALRILITLQNGGFVRCGLSDKLYRLSPRMGFSAGFNAANERLAEIGAPVLAKLSQNIEWPIDLTTRQGLFMESIETSRRQSPFAPSMDVTRLGERINVIASAVGRAYLAYCSRAELQRIIEAAMASNDPLCRDVNDARNFNSELSEIRKQGYAVRAPYYLGQTDHTGMNYQDNLASFAVAIVGSKSTYGALVILWPKSVSSVKHMVEKHLFDLKSAALEIASKLEG